ncbi:MAG: hypothetical protein ACLGIR_09410 [Actinomycetes bacterium]
MAEPTPDPTPGQPTPDGDGDEPTPWVAEVDPAALGGYTPPPGSDPGAPSGHATLGEDLERLAADLAADLGATSDDVDGGDLQSGPASEVAENDPTRDLGTPADLDLPDGGWDDVAVASGASDGPSSSSSSPAEGDLPDDDGSADEGFDLSDLEQAVVEFGFEDAEPSVGPGPVPPPPAAPSAPAADLPPPPSGTPLPPPTGRPTPGTPPTPAPPPDLDAPAPSTPEPVGSFPSPESPAETPDPAEAGIDTLNFTAKGGSGSVSGGGGGGERGGRRLFGR